MSANGKRPVIDGRPANRRLAEWATTKSAPPAIAAVALSPQPTAAPTIAYPLATTPTRWASTASRGQVQRALRLHVRGRMTARPSAAWGSYSDHATRAARDHDRSAPYQCRRQAEQSPGSCRRATLTAPARTLHRAGAPTCAKSVALPLGRRHITRPPGGTAKAHSGRSSLKPAAMQSRRGVR